MKFSTKDFFNKCAQIQIHAQIHALRHETVNGKLHFLCSDLNAFRLKFNNYVFYFYRITCHVTFTL